MRESSALARAAQVLGPAARHDVPVGPMTTFRVGGSTALFLTVGSHADLALAGAAVAASGIEVLVVGRGSNLLVADSGFPGLVIALGEAHAGLERDGTVIRAGGSAPLPVLARRTAAWGLTGMEWAVGVPGSVGGGVRMNAGGHGSDMAASLRRARLVDLAGGSDEVVEAGDLALGYRRSAVGPNHVVVWAEVALRTGDPATGEAAVAEVVRWRRRHQPGGQNAGSVFTNPPGHSAGALVEAAGCKGLSRGSAHVSSRHANFIQAEAGGSASDVAALVAEVARRVKRASGVELHPELRMVGFSEGEVEV